MGDREAAPVSVLDYEPLARARLPVDVWEYVQGGSGSEATLRANTAALATIRLRPRVLVGVAEADLTTALLGDRLRAPLGVAPMAYHRLVHPEGELATAQAAGDAGVPFVVSMFSSCTLEDIAARAAGPLWLQLYWLRQRDALIALVRRAEAAGFRALVLTVDTPRVGRRRRDVRTGFAIPAHVQAVNLDPSVMASAHRSAPGRSAIERHAREQMDPSVTWADLDWLRERTSLPLVLKGILTGEDADIAARHGADAVIVSNHGGRQLDHAVAAADALPEVVEAAAGRYPVIVDGGVRSGVDVLKALALGADAAFVGRPVLWGLAAAGASGAADVLRLLCDELEEALVLAGRGRLEDVDRSLVSTAGGWR